MPNVNGGPSTSTSANTTATLGTPSTLSSASALSVAARSSTVSPAIVSSSVNLAKYARSRAAYAAVKAGTGFMKIVILGDSTTMGAYATGTYPNPVEGCRPFSAIPAFVQSLTTYDVPSIDGGLCGDSNVSAQLKQDGVTVATVADYDVGRVATLPAGWSSLAAGNVLTLGGNCINGTGANSFQFRPFEPTDTLEVYVRHDTGLSTNWTITKSGSSETLTGQTAADTTALVKHTLKCAAPTINLWSIQRVSGGGGLYPCILDAYDSTKPSVRVFNAGWSSSRTSDWVVSTSPWSPLSALIALNPDLVIIQPGINEYNNAGDQTGSPSATVGGQKTSTYQGFLSTIVQSLLSSGIDVALRSHYPSQNSNRNLVMQKPYRDVTLAVANTYGIAVDDLWTKLSTWEQQNNKGWMADALHPNVEMYRRSGESMAALVQALMTA